MNPRTNLSLAVLVLLAVFSLFAAPSEAWALDQEVNFSVQWQGLADPYNVDAKAIFLNSQGQEVAALPLTTQDNVNWTGTYNNVPSTATRVILVFDDSRFNWDIGSPHAAQDINWGNPQPINFNDACWQW
ncbi:MAG: hypothetical protein FJY67_06275 [Calditrichaeota bacterium]|nr:hypothetical protein [Calditrichota bacterium]